jgi:hypothetical protein
MNCLKFGACNAAKEYFTKSAFTSVSNMVKSNFGQMTRYDDEEIEAAIQISNTFILMLVLAGVIIGFLAVPRLCQDNSERGKNIRLALYVLLILTGGQFGWFFALLWLFKINICA